MTAHAEFVICNYTIERCFRTLKTSQLQLEPVYHRLSRRLEAHVKICVMALLIERVVELSCQQSWHQLLPVMEPLQVTQFQTQTHQFFQRNAPSAELSALLKTLDIPLPKKVLGITPLTEPTDNP